MEEPLPTLWQGLTDVAWVMGDTLRMDTLGHGLEKGRFTGMKESTKSRLNMERVMLMHSFSFVALSQSQPFSPAAARPGGPASFPSQPPLSGQSMPMTSPGVLPPGPALFTPASVPLSQVPAASPFPVASQSPLGFSSAPFSCPMNMGYPQGGPGAPSTKPLPAASLPPPPTGKYCLGDLGAQALVEAVCST